MRLAIQSSDSVPRLRLARVLLASLLLSLPLSAAKPPTPELLQMIADLLASPDRDTRGLGLQEVREGLPGPGATRHFAELLPRLDATGQAALLDALGDRGDRTARPAVLEATTNPQEQIRVSALGALLFLGDASDIPLLAGKAASGSGAEREMARRVLTRLPGLPIDQALSDALSVSTPPVCIELLAVLAARKTTNSISAVLRCAAGPDRSVRLAALNTAQVLASEKDLTALVQLLNDAKDESERTAAEAALLADCGRSGPGCAPILADRLPSSSLPTRLALLRALAVVGGAQALAVLQEGLAASDPIVQAESLRLLSLWPNPAAAPSLFAFAREPGVSPRQVLALRALIRLASPDETRAANFDWLAEAWSLAKRAEDKRLVLAALGTIATPDSLKLAAQGLQAAEIRQEAAWAVVAIAEKLPLSSDEESQAALEKILKMTSDPSLRDRINKLLKR